MTASTTHVFDCRSMAQRIRRLVQLTGFRAGVLTLAAQERIRIVGTDPGRL